MKKWTKVIGAAFLGAALALPLAACTGEKEVSATFSYEEPDDVTVETGLDLGGLSYVEGGNIAATDYSVSGESLTFKKEYLATVREAKTEFEVVTLSGSATVTLRLTTRNPRCVLPNGGFETGNLAGWKPKTVFKGESGMQAFSDEGVKKNKNYFIVKEYGGDGDWVYGFDDAQDGGYESWGEKTGILQSQPFLVGGCGIVSFKLGGGKNSALNYLSVKDAETDIELYRFGNDRYDGREYRENLVQYTASLSKHAGRRVYFEVCDFGSGASDFMTFDSFVTYYETQPDLKDAFPALNILPAVAYESNPVAVLRNMDFYAGLEDYAIAAGTDTFTVRDKVLRSDLSGDGATGVLRSGAFTLQGSGYIGFSLGAACGERYDKNTFVLVREAGSNAPVARFANTRHEGAKLVHYYADLSEHLGKTLYFEFVDNAKDAYGTLFVSDLETYFEKAPEIKPLETAENLNF